LIKIDGYNAFYFIKSQDFILLFKANFPVFDLNPPDEKSLTYGYEQTHYLFIKVFQNFLLSLNLSSPAIQED